MSTNKKISGLAFSPTAQDTDLVAVDRDGSMFKVRSAAIAERAPNAGLTQILSSAVSGGNPAFFSAGAAVPTGINLNILGATVPLVYQITGTKQILDGDVTLTLPTTAGEQLRFIFALKTANWRVTQSEFLSSSMPPFWAYAQPTAPAGTSTTNPAYWFDMSTNTCWKATSSGGSWTQVTDMILLGVVLMNATTAIRAVLCEPFRLDHAKRLQLFGDGSDAAAAFGAQQVVTGSSTIPFGINFTRGGAISGSSAVLSHGATNNDIGGIIYSQTPVIITNSGKFGQTGRGMNGGAGSAAATGSAGTGGGMGATGAGGGGGVANTGGAGGPQGVPGRPSITSAGGGGGTAGNNGTGGGVPLSIRVFTPGGLLSWIFCMLGAGGGGGAAQASSTGGAGGKGGGVHILIAPSILLDTGCTATSAGDVGSDGTGTNAGGGGGGGGGLVMLAGGYVILLGTITAAGGAAGNKLGSGCGNGGIGGAGLAKVVKMW